MLRDMFLFLLLGAVIAIPLLIIWVAMSPRPLSPILAAGLIVIICVLAGAAFEFYLNLSYALLGASIVGLAFGAATIKFGSEISAWRS